MAGLYAESGEPKKSLQAELASPSGTQTLEPPKRPRGRPKGSAGKNPKAPKKNDTLTERYEQRRVVTHCERQGYTFFAIPNAARRSMWEAMEAKRSGMKAGIPDLCFPVARHGYNGLWVEMKRIEGGVISPIQEYWLALLKENRYEVHVCHGADEAIPVIDEYFRGWAGQSSAVRRMLEDVIEAKRAKYAKDKVLQSGADPD